MNHEGHEEHEGNHEEHEETNREFFQPPMARTGEKTKRGGRESAPFPCMAVIVYWFIGVFNKHEYTNTRINDYTKSTQ